MKNLRMLGAASLFALLSVTLFAGCGDPGMGEQTLDGKTCTTQDDCRDKDGKDTHLCVRDGKKGADNKKAFVCRANCTKEGKAHQDSCGVAGTNETCTELKGEAGSEKKFACIKTGTTQSPDVDHGSECTADNVAQRCQGPLAYCDPTQNKCKNRPIKQVVIVDKSSGEACSGKNKTDAGSDIMAVSFSDPSGGAAEWAAGAYLVEGDIPASGIGYNQTGSISGSAPSFVSGRCIVDNLYKNTDKFVSIGCGGKLVLNFNETQSVPGKLTVYEYDSNVCAKTKPNPKSPEDKYEVYVCTGSVDHTNVDTKIAEASTCEKVAEESTGIVDITIPAGKR